MNFFYPHRYWLATLTVSMALALFSTPLLDFLQDGAAHHLAAMRDARATAEKSLDQLESDIAETKRLSRQIGVEDIEKSLAPVDRLQAADILEKQAAASRLNHFTYTLSPEEKVTVKTPEARAEELAVSTITIKADAPLDTDAYAFVERLRTLLPGRLRPQEITLERIGAEGAAPAADNLHVTATFEWLSNGVAKQVADGK